MDGRGRGSGLPRGRVLGLGGCALVAVWGAGLWAGPAVASTSVPMAAAAPCAGVSVVVDAGALGAPGVRGCAPLRSESSLSGLDALTAAGLSIEGTAQWGTAFVCRVDDRPGAQEDIPLPDGTTVRERCDRTPSALAYWSVWQSDGAEWRYAATGVSDLDLGSGDALALVFTTGPQAAAPPPIPPAQAQSGELPDGWTDLAPAVTASATVEPQEAEASGTSSRPTTSGSRLLPLAAVVLIVLGGAGAAGVARRRR